MEIKLKKFTDIKQTIRIKPVLFFQKLPYNCSFIELTLENILKIKPENINKDFIIIYKGKKKIDSKKIKFCSFLPIIYYYNNDEYFIQLNITTALQLIKLKKITNILNILISIKFNLLVHKDDLYRLNNIYKIEKINNITIPVHKSILSFPGLVRENYHQGSLVKIFKSINNQFNEKFNYIEFGSHYGKSIEEFIDIFKNNLDKRSFFSIYDFLVNYFYYRDIKKILFTVELQKYPKLESINELISRNNFNGNLNIGYYKLKEKFNFVIDNNYINLIFYDFYNNENINLLNILNYPTNKKTIYIFNLTGIDNDSILKIKEKTKQKKLYLIFQNFDSLVISTFKFKINNIYNKDDKFVLNLVNLLLKKKIDQAFDILDRNKDKLQMKNDFIFGGNTVLHLLSRIKRIYGINIPNYYLKKINESKLKNDIGFIPKIYLFKNFKETVIHDYYNINVDYKKYFKLKFKTLEKTPIEHQFIFNLSSKKSLNLNNFNDIINFKNKLFNYNNIIISQDNIINNVSIISYFPILINEGTVIITNSLAYIMSFYFNKIDFNEGLKLLYSIQGDIIYNKDIYLELTKYKLKDITIKIPLHKSDLNFPDFKPIGWFGKGCKKNFDIVKKYISNEKINYIELGTYYGLSSTYVLEKFKNNFDNISKVELCDFFTNYMTSSKKTYLMKKDSFYYKFPKLEVLNYYYKNKLNKVNIIFNKGLIKLDKININNNYINLFFFDFEKNYSKVKNYIKKIKKKYKNIILIFDDLNCFNMQKLVNNETFFNNLNLKIISYNEISLLIVDNKLIKKFNFKKEINKYSENEIYIFKLIYNLLNNKKNDKLWYLIRNEKIPLENELFQFGNSWFHEIAKIQKKLKIEIPNDILEMINNSKLKNTLGILPKEYLVLKTYIDVSLDELFNWNYIKSNIL